MDGRTLAHNLALMNILSNLYWSLQPPVCRGVGRETMTFIIKHKVYGRKMPKQCVRLGQPSN